MGHNPNKIVKTKERKQVLETRSPEDIIKGIRGNLVAHLSGTPSDIAFLLVAFDAEKEFSHKLTEENVDLKAQIADLEEKVAWARQVYEDENRSFTIAIPESAAPTARQEAIEDAIEMLENRGGEA